jgi:aminoglycoside phosphotransferase (APT) family kinase protein
LPDEYQSYLARLHQKKEIPEGILFEALREVSPKSVKSRRRLTGGETNEVYDIRFDDDTDVIVRISRDAEKNFEQEAWAIEKCAERDIPVPEILALRHLSVPGQPLDICMQRKIPGSVLTDLSLSEEDRRAYARKAGDYLSRIHDVSADGFGYLNARGQGEASSSSTEANELLLMEPEFQALGQKHGIAGALISRAIVLSVEDAAANNVLDACLIHNDFAARHVMVSERKVSGIIDFGEVAGGEPLLDLVKWRMLDAKDYPFTWLQEGYQNQAVFTPEFSRRLDIKTVESGLWRMRYYDRQGYVEGVADVREQFLANLSTII